MSIKSTICLIVLVLFSHNVVGETLWRGLVVKPEERCSSYDRGDYPHPPSVEDRIVEEYGEIYSPYTKTRFNSKKETGC